LTSGVLTSGIAVINIGSSTNSPGVQ